MNTDPSLENEEDLAKRVESRSSKVESAAEDREEDRMRGAQILEKPVNGKWEDTLKAFSDWFKKIFAKKP